MTELGDGGVRGEARKSEAKSSLGTAVYMGQWRAGFGNLFCTPQAHLPCGRPLTATNDHRRRSNLPGTTEGQPSAAGVALRGLPAAVRAPDASTFWQLAKLSTTRQTRIRHFLVPVELRKDQAPQKPMRHLASAPVRQCAPTARSRF